MDPPECSGHSHDHDHGDDQGLSLRTYIDFSQVSCLNEEVNGTGKLVLKIHEERLSESPSVTSPEDDPELLFYIPFTESVTVQSIAIRNASRNNDNASARRIKIFTNRDNIDFETARELPAQQQLELLPPHHFADGTIDYPCRPAGKFSNISSLAIFVQDNYDDSGESPTEITFVGLKGKGTRMKRVAVEAVYESRGMPEDHKVNGGEFGARDLV
uniref:PITH domain-containing protein n=1 Tax=Entomoneis paludosa TaxID=265537 RepID=A0A7S2Y139_9STRA|mmetsp:Transcript_10184/g.21033  ORF Transcript_10184/g.21033 Transcript_10184/m.21033 type:complete len:215 (+) Transcript_10184:132-776(+)